MVDAGPKGCRSYKTIICGSALDWGIRVHSRSFAVECLFRPSPFAAILPTMNRTMDNLWRRLSRPWMARVAVLAALLLPAVEAGATRGVPRGRGLDLAGVRDHESLDASGGIGGLLAIRERVGDGPETTRHVISDPQGNVMALADPAGTLVARFDYDPFGRLIMETGEAGSCPFRYSTKYRDPDLELYCYGHRWYDPSAMKWLTPDPIGERGGVNLTAFCANDPVNKVDALGERALDLWELDDPLEYSVHSLERRNIYNQKSEVGERFARYLSDSVQFMVQGEYYEGRPNGLGISGSIILGFTGANFLCDSRDVFHNVENWENSWSHVGRTSLNAIGMVPVIGFVKNLRSLRYLDEGVEIVEQGVKKSRHVRRLSVRVSSGAELAGTPGRTTTVLGQYGGESGDMRRVVREVTGGMKRWDNPGNPGGFNVLNVPNGAVRWGRDAFWDLFNRPFLDDAIERGDVFVLATRPTAEVLVDSVGELTGFGREYRYLLDRGYVYDFATSRMIRQ